MAPDRGSTSIQDSDPPPYPPETEEETKYLPEGRHFTLRGIAAGLLVGLM
ncbi:hypothetical protein PC116_g33163 [Phytophthora cactorum]|nr:hypothetical protein PC116_g33163 [Phytophthora cactorum]